MFEKRACKLTGGSDRSHPYNRQRAAAYCRRWPSQADLRGWNRPEACSGLRACVPWYRQSGSKPVVPIWVQARAPGPAGPCAARCRMVRANVVTTGCKDCCMRRHGSHQCKRTGITRMRIRIVYMCHAQPRAVLIAQRLIDTPWPALHSSGAGNAAAVALLDNATAKRLRARPGAQHEGGLACTPRKLHIRCASCCCQCRAQPAAPQPKGAPGWRACVWAQHGMQLTVHGPHWV